MNSNSLEFVDNICREIPTDQSLLYKVESILSSSQCTRCKQLESVINTLERKLSTLSNHLQQEKEKLVFAEEMTRTVQAIHTTNSCANCLVKDAELNKLRALINSLEQRVKALEISNNQLQEELDEKGMICPDPSMHEIIRPDACDHHFVERKVQLRLSIFDKFDIIPPFF